MKGLFLAIVAALALTLASVPALGQTDQAAGMNPPISQPLVREGTFAYALAGALDLGAVTNEAAAETMLSSAGIEPKNGWIADYPVTPEIAGELQNAVGLAADSGSLTMSRDDALSAFQNVAEKYGLPVTEGQTGATGEVPEAPSYSDNPAMNDYYYEEGPPVITYYAPPPAYSYLYTWVPYPFWWTDYWFPGFFVLYDFDRTVIVHGHHEHFSNHFFDRERHRFARVEADRRPHMKAFAGTERGRGREVHNRRNITGGMNGIMRWRHGFASGGHSFVAAPRGGAQARQPYPGRTFMAPSGGHRQTARQPAMNSVGRIRPDFGQRSVPRATPNISTARPYRPFEGGRAVEAAPRQRQGGHSFNGFRSYSGSYRRSFGGERTFASAPYPEGGRSFGGYRGFSRGGFHR